MVFTLLKAGIKTAVGLRVDHLALVLWGAGLAGGALLGWLVARKERRFLLREELGVAVFLGLVRLHHLGYRAREALPEPVRLPRLWRPGSWRGLR